MATVFTLLALAITVSHWEPGYMYNGTNILMGAAQPELEPEVVALAVAATVAGVAVAALVVGAAVAALLVGAAVAGLVVAAEVAGLVVAAAVAGMVVPAGDEEDEGLVVGATVALEAVEVAGLLVGADEGLAVAELPEYVTPVSTTPTEGEAMMLLIVT
jgi:hypothetical protein